MHIIVLILGLFISYQPAVVEPFMLNKEHRWSEHREVCVLPLFVYEPIGQYYSRLYNETKTHQPPQTI